MTILVGYPTNRRAKAVLSLGAGHRKNDEVKKRSSDYVIVRIAVFAAVFAMLALAASTFSATGAPLAHDQVAAWADKITTNKDTKSAQIAANKIGLWWATSLFIGDIIQQNYENS